MSEAQTESVSGGAFSAPSMLERYHTLLTALMAGAISAEAAAELLLRREEIAAALQKSSTLTLELGSALVELDQRLEQHLAILWNRHRSALTHLRALIDPPKAHWWWYEPGGGAIWTIAALFLLTVSISMMTDFTRRLLASDPDVAGIMAIASQAVFAVIASSTFTSAGREWLQKLFNRVNTSPAQQNVLKCVSVAILFAIVFSCWEFLPHVLAVHYNKRGLDLSQSNPSVSVRDYNRAISLDPHYVNAYVDLATLYVRNYDFDKAAAEYRQALIIDVKHLTAYNDLAYVLLLGKDPSTALRIMDDAFRLSAPDKLNAQDAAALYKNMAWAEYQTGFFAEAARDAALGVAADKTKETSYCVLAKALTKLNRPAAALQAWQQMNEIAIPATQPIIEPDCARLAKEALDATH